MKQTRWLTGLVVVQALALAGLGYVLWRQPEPGGTGKPTAAAERTSDLADGERRPDAQAASADAPAAPGVQMAAAMQASSGIRVAPVQGRVVPVAEPIWGEVLPGAPLAEARLRLLQAQADVAQWVPQVAHAGTEWQRLDSLWRAQGNVAGRVVDQARADLDLLQQRMQAAEQARQAIRQAILQDWGSQMLAQLEQPDGGQLAGVLAGREHLLLVADGGFVRGTLLPSGPGGQSAACRRVAPAPQHLSGSLAASWFWLSSANTLRSGQRVQVAAGQGGRTAAWVPESAVVWHAGAAWVYLALADHRFLRRALVMPQAMSDGWVDRSLPIGQSVVVEGAQLLLSEESRAQIRNENGD